MTATLERGRVRKFLSLVMIEHSVFALPFAYIAALTAMWRATGTVHWVQLLLITVAMVAARTVAMSANRILDRELRRAEPPHRAARAGHRRAVRASAWIGPPSRSSSSSAARRRCPGCALRWRRWRWPCSSSTATASGSPTSRRCCSAIAQFVAPVGAWIAVTGSGSWAADRARHRRRHLDRRLRPDLLLPGRRGRPPDRLALVPGPLRHPAALTRPQSSTSSRSPRSSGSGSPPTWARGGSGVALTAGVLVYEHRIVRADDLSRVNRAFFTANGVIGIGLFAFALADLIAHGLAA